MANSTTSLKGSSTGQRGKDQSSDRGRQSTRPPQKPGSGEGRGGGDADDADLAVPMNKVSPVVWAAVGVVALGIVGGVVYMLVGRPEPPKVDYQSAIYSAQVAADKAKAEQQQRLEHLQQAQKAWQIASEQQAAQAQPSDNAAENAGQATPSSAHASGTPAGQGKAKPKSGAGANDLEQLDKLGSAVNSELGK